MSRVVRYEVRGEFSEWDMERLLRGAKARGVVKDFDTGRGLLAWFEGRPGGALRDVRRRAQALASPPKVG